MSEEVLIYLLIVYMTIDYLRIRASNKKQIEKMLLKRREDAGFLIMLLLIVGIIGLAGLLFLF